MKRLRKRCGDGIRFFHCGEYGEEFSRPHYHAILFTITSVRDGVHMPGSFHYSGLAFDIRIFDLRGVLAHVVADRLREALGSLFTVVLEQDHIHVEFDHEETRENLAAKV